MDLTSMIREESVNMEWEGWKEFERHLIFSEFHWDKNVDGVHFIEESSSSAALETASVLHLARKLNGFLLSCLWVMAVWKPWQPCRKFWSSPGAAKALMSYLEAAVIAEKTQGRLPVPQSAPCMWHKHTGGNLLHTVSGSCLSSQEEEIFFLPLRVRRLKRTDTRMSRGIFYVTSGQSGPASTIKKALYNKEGGLLSLSLIRRYKDVWDTF